MRADCGSRCPAPCGKLRFYTRRGARKWAKAAHPGEHMNAYPCGGFFHIGHHDLAARLAGRRGGAA